VIEVNGRLAGWVDDLAMRSGAVDVADAAVTSALGREVVMPKPGATGPIAFHYVIVSPTSATRVKAMRNASGLRRLPNVGKVYVRVRPGSPVSWRLGATTSVATIPSSSVAAVLGSADSHDRLAQTIAEIDGFDWIDYE